jgi:hypothetical protein
MATKFPGIDYAELADHFGIDLEVEWLNGLPVENHKVICAWLGEHGYEDDHGMKPKPEIISTLRTWLAEFIQKDGSYGTELWIGLSKVKDDWYFMRYFRYLMGFMWT